MGVMLYATAPFMPGDEIRFSTSQEKDIEGTVVLPTLNPEPLTLNPKP
jgi:hypothetical protein